MIGAILGFVTCLFLQLAEITGSWWWLLWGTLIGFLVEVVLRVGAGGDVAEAFGDAACSLGELAGDTGGGCGDSGGGCGDGGGD